MERTEELAGLLAELNDRDGAHATTIPGVYLSRYSSTRVPRNTLDRAIFCLVAQGMKTVLLNERRLRYEAGTYLMIPLDLPLVSQVAEATPERPCLGLSVELDFAELGALMLEAGLPARAEPWQPHSVSVSLMDEELLDVIIRLTRLLKTPAQIPILAPLVRRELFYKLLLREQSGALRRMTTGNGQARRIASGIEWLKQNIARPIRMDELARRVNMSPSTMHAWFKAVTSMSPLQFQKQLRLQEARRILLSETTDAATASRRVGYESPSQFSREYRRLFGAPPLRDIERLRSAAAAAFTPVAMAVSHAGD